LPLRSQFVLSGNVKDLQTQEINPDLITAAPLIDILAAELKIAGFAHILVYDPSTGIRVTDPLVQPANTDKDARNVTTTYTYDQINRRTSVRYSGDPNTPGEDFYYDGYSSGNYTNIPNVKGRAWKNETLGQVRFVIDSFDVTGRPTVQRQQFWTNNAWGSSFQVSVAYDLSGNIINQTYPSGHTVSYDLDQAGRLTNFSATWAMALHGYTQITFNTMILGPCNRKSLALRLRFTISNASTFVLNCGMFV
jgi:YD repeat-containing protein